MGSAHGQGQGAWNGLSLEANPSFPRRREEAYGGGGLAGPTSGEAPQPRAHSPPSSISHPACAQATGGH